MYFCFLILVRGGLIPLSGLINQFQLELSTFFPSALHFVTGEAKQRYINQIPIDYTEIDIGHRITKQNHIGSIVAFIFS